MTLGAIRVEFHSGRAAPLKAHKRIVVEDTTRADLLILYSKNAFHTVPMFPHHLHYFAHHRTSQTV